MKFKSTYYARGPGLWRTVRRTLAIVAIGVSLASCGGGSDGDSDPVIIGTGYTGTASTDRLLADGSVQIRVNSGRKISTPVNSNGTYSTTDNEASSEPVLSRIDLGNNEFLYGIGYPDSEGNIQHNIHSYSDLIVRSWFANQGLDVDVEYGKSDTISLPTQAQVQAINNRLRAIMTLVLDDYGVSNADLLTDVFATDNTGIDSFLDNNPVIINNGVINIVINQNTGNAQGQALSDVPINTDLASSDTENPTTPQNIRALASNASDIIIVWDPATDNIGVSAYKVFRDGVDIGMTPYPVFTDTGLATGVTFTYTIVAVDAAGNESMVSAEASTQTSGVTDTTPPAAPLALATNSVTTSSVTISWQHADVSDVVAFELSRDGVLIASTSATFATDTGLNAGTNFCYTAVALDAAGNRSPASDQFCVDTSGTAVGPVTPPAASDNVVTLSSNAFQVLESSGSVSISVNRTGSSGEVSVDYMVTDGTAVDGQDFTATSGTLNWPVGSTSPQVITVQIAADAVAEVDETFTVSLSNPANASLGTPATATVTISNSAEKACDTELETLLVNENTTLNLPCYLIAGTLDVRQPAKLTIQPGVELRFTDGSGVIVRSGGSMSAQGTAAQPILFTGLEKTPGYWDGIRFSSSGSVNNILRDVIVEYGGSSSNGDANLFITSSKVTVENSTLRQSAGYGFHIDTSSDEIDLVNSVVTLNETAGRTGPMSASNFADNNNLTGNTNDYVEVISDVIDAITSWVDIGVPWHVDGLDVRSPFTVEAGNQLKFESATTLIVRSTGALAVNGTAEQPVLISGTTETPGWWNGVHFSSAPSTQNSLSHTVIEHAGTTSNGDANLRVTGTSSRLKANDITLRNSAGYGFSLANGAVISEFSNVTSTGNASPGLVAPDVAGSIGPGGSFTGNTVDLINVDGSVFDLSQTWLTHDVPYSVDGLDIRADLKLSPGTELQVLQGEQITVRSNGTFNAVGTNAENIRITSDLKINGSWGGIQFSSSVGPLNKLDFTVVEYGGTSATTGNITASCSNANIPSVTVTNSNIDNGAGWGIFVTSGCSVALDNTVSFMGNNEGGINVTQ